MSETAPTTRTLYLATWSRRFGAWLIDVLVVGAILSVVGEGVAAIPGVGVPIVFTGSNALALFVYWTALEGTTGQSLGKPVLDLEVTDREGEGIGYGTAAVESFGKAFLLPLDCLIGWLAMPGEKLRLFNRASKTIVIWTEGEADPEGVEYVIPEE